MNVKDRVCMERGALCIDYMFRHVWPTWHILIGHCSSAYLVMKSRLGYGEIAHNFKFMESIIYLRYHAMYDDISTM